jgi:hypothetical protein
MFRSDSTDSVSSSSQEPPKNAHNDFYDMQFSGGAHGFLFYGD